MAAVREAKMMYNFRAQDSFYQKSYDSDRRSRLIDSLEEYSIKLDTLIEKTSNIDQIFLQADE